MGFWTGVVVGLVAFPVATALGVGVVVWAAQVLTKPISGRVDHEGRIHLE